MQRYLQYAILYFDFIYVLLLVAIYQDKYTQSTKLPTLTVILVSQALGGVAWLWHLVLDRSVLIVVQPFYPQTLFPNIGYHCANWAVSAMLTSGYVAFSLLPVDSRMVVPPIQLTHEGLVWSVPILRTLLLSGLLALYTVGHHLPHPWQQQDFHDLPDAVCESPGGIPSTSSDDTDSEDLVLEHPLLVEDSEDLTMRNPTVKYKPEVPTLSLSDQWCRLKQLLPFMFPEHMPLSLYVCVILCLLTLGLGRWINVLVPAQYKVVVDHLGTGSLAFHDLALFVFLKVLQGDIGLLQTFHDFSWTPVSQYITRAVAVRMFQHLHKLPLQFHTNRRTGEILRVQDRGVASIESLLSSVLFKIVPTVADMTIACLYFSFQFDLYFGCVVILTMTLYVVSTIILTEWHKHYRRRSNILDNEMEAKAVDSLLNYETVKHNNAEEFEVRVYRDAMRTYQKAEWMNVVSLNILHAIQNFSMQFGMLVGCLLCAQRIIRGDMTVGDFVLFMSYLNQMYVPLNWFGNYYRVIQKNFVDMERMLEVLHEAPEDTEPLVVEDPASPQEPVPADHIQVDTVQGDIEFSNVSFCYHQDEPILRDISFRVPAGSTVALVGPSGSGKSTILKLLYRFYEVDRGAITIDGWDIQSLPPRALRRFLGMVPQDTALFNDTIRFNIQYGRAGCDFEQVTLKEVQRSARAAQIHNKIVTLPEGYETQVGERGARLSGGERQRIAIARTILKNPSIVLLDEATSALDTYTELSIQSALQTMTHNRTTLIVAHRLSTIVHADLILVLKDGRIVERGSHNGLVRDPRGLYHRLWFTQLQEDQELARSYRPTYSPDSTTDTSSFTVSYCEDSVE
ncbi:ATP-binding cassette-type vacuolar membrane transporter Hmt1 [Dispira simplex]|nr:ATP-binding cassette-type vacuolar membrane transporter Hmt1 [Dispira simplex]